MIIEFVAVTGSGKTYISELLGTYLKQDHRMQDAMIYTTSDIWKAMDPTESKLINKGIRILDRMHCLFCVPVLRMMILLLFSNCSIIIRIQKITYYLSIINLYKVIRRLRNRNKAISKKLLFILDEGFLHASEIFLDDRMDDLTEEFLREYRKAVESIKYIDYPEMKKLYIFVESDSKVNFNRLNRRPEGWPILLRPYTETEKLEALVDFQAKVDRIKSYISTVSTPCLSIDNTRDHTGYPDKFITAFETIKHIVYQRFH